MPTSESEQMLTLLQEKAMLKQLDEEYAAGPRTEEAKNKHEERKGRHAEIAREIVRLGQLAKQE